MTDRNASEFTDAVDDHTMLRQGLRRSLETQGVRADRRGGERRRPCGSLDDEAGRRPDGRVDARHRRHRRPCAS